MAWIRSKCKKRSYVTLHSLCICRLTLACISCENSTNHEECWLILTGLPSLLLDFISYRLVSAAVRWRLPLASPFANCLLWVTLFNSYWRSLAYFRSRRDLESKTFVWFLSWFGCVLFFLLFFLYTRVYRIIEAFTHLHIYTHTPMHIYWVFIRPNRSFLPFPSATSSFVLTCNPRSILLHGTSVIISVSAARCISY